MGKCPYWLDWIPQAKGKPPLYQIVRKAQRIGLPMTEAQALAETARREKQHAECVECRKRARARETRRARKVK